MTGLSPRQLASNGIGVAGCNPLFAAVATHPKLSNLDLGYSPSTGVLGATAQSDWRYRCKCDRPFIARNQTLLKLNLCRNGIGNLGKKALIAALEINQKLRYLILDGQPDRRMEVLLERNRMLNLGEELHHPRSVSLIQSVYR